MKRLLKILGILLFLGILGSCFLRGASEDYQKDADRMRLEHLVYWSGLIEEYQKKTGYYPLQDSALKYKDKPILVKIATTAQRQYLSKDGANYRPQYDNNASGSFHEMPVKYFVAEMEHKLGRKIFERYDLQSVPSGRPIGYNYFATEDGYLLWVTCHNCGVTPISTLLMDGSVPTVNIVSSGMKGKVTKALPRDEMLNHPIFKSWMAKGIEATEYVRKVEKENASDSKR